VARSVRGRECSDRVASGRFLLGPGDESRPGAVDAAGVDQGAGVGSEAAASFGKLHHPAESRRRAWDGVRDLGAIPDAELKTARDAGITDVEILETVANVALNYLTNAVNRLAQTDIEFPSPLAPDLARSWWPPGACHVNMGGARRKKTISSPTPQLAPCCYGRGTAALVVIRWRSDGRGSGP
jgi:hypothetical protein